MTSPPEARSRISAVKLALMAKQMRGQAETVLRATPIAIVGMGCRVPGGGDTPAHLWKKLCDGVDAVRDIPSDRWDADAWYDSDQSVPAKSITRWGGFLDKIDEFDSEYFGILSREAERMDPQQRLLLEVAIEAIDDAGLPHERLRGSRTGVYVASYHSDYAHLQHNDVEDIELRTLTGTLHSVVANRLSYFLDLRSPSLTIDTGCSSSLVAIHTACQSLRFGEIDLAIAGGVSLIITPELMVSMSKVGFVSPAGRCKTFDAEADGFVRGEGCGVVVLKRLSDAIADNDRILAVIRGSAVNQDGRSTLLAAPNGPAQVALIRESLASAQIEPGRVGFFEAHGTGTALGDPIEVEAIAETIGHKSAGTDRCLIGSLKANIGHLEAAAGVTGLIKAVLALRNEAVPPQVNFSKLNPHISLANTRLAVPTALTPWPRTAVPRVAAVSGFGIGGTNANVILEESPRVAEQAGDENTNSPRMLTLSAHNSTALKALAQSWIQFLSETTESVSDLCYTASRRRTHYDRRIAVTGRTKDELREQLQNWMDREELPDAGPAPRRTSEAPRVGFVFSGQGPQWYAMGRELLAQEPVFTEVINACDKLLRPFSNWSLLDELARSESDCRLDQTEIAQPALFAIQSGLAALWKSWGILPVAVVGHSIGEIAALYTAGVLDLPEAIRIVWHRGKIMQQATGLGRMASVGLTEDEARELIKSHGERLSIGAVNGPRSVVLSGETEALESALAILTQRNVTHRMLPVKYAFHSAQMAPFGDELVRQLGTVKTGSPTLAIYSTVTGGLASSVSFDAAYFGRNLREPVRFANAMQALLKDDCDVVIELAPQPVLAASIAECAANSDRSPLVLASLRRGRPELETMLQACAGAYAAGCNPVWDRVQPRMGRVVDLPIYPWQRRRHWIRKTAARELHAVSGEHPLLGRRVELAGIETHVFESNSREARSWLVDHRISGQLLLPGAAVLEMFAAAGRTILECELLRLKEFTMHRPLVIPEHGRGEARWQVIGRKIDGGVELELHAATPAESGASNWQRVATATAVSAPALPVAPEVPESDCRKIGPDVIYEKYRNLGADFGPTFRCLHDVGWGKGLARASVRIPDSLEHAISRHLVHPVLIDSALQLCAIAKADDGDAPLSDDLLLPLGADDIVVCPGPYRQLSARAHVREKTSNTLVADVWLTTPDGATVFAIEGMRFARAEPRALSSDADNTVYEIAWRHGSAQRGKPADVAGPWLVFADSTGTADALTEEIEAAGGVCWRVQIGKELARTGERSWTLDPSIPGHFSQLLAQGGWNNGTALRGVVHCWSLDDAATILPSTAAELPGLGSTLHLVQALAKTASLDGSLWLVTRGAQSVSGSEVPAELRPRAAGLWGLANVISIEQPGLAVRVIDLDPASGHRDATGLFAELVYSGDFRIALRGRERWAPRLQNYRHPVAERAGAPAANPRQAIVAHPGTLDGVELASTPHKPLRSDEVRIKVLASGLNFRDVMLALGMYPGANLPLGAECSGIVTEVGAAVGGLKTGDRVLGFAPESLATEVTVPAAFVAPLPNQISAEDAAGVPVAFLTAHYGLNRLARLRRGQRILIHAAAGGVGLAAVQLAQRQGAEVFATAGSPEKRDLLHTLGVAHVMDSRSLMFADQILSATGGKGVDVVLNSLAGDFISASMRALGQGGCFLELGKRDILTTETAEKMRPDVRYHAYDLGTELHADRALLRSLLDEILAAFADGSLRPLPVTVFPLDELTEAMRFMAQARHIGKIVLRAPDTSASARDATFQCAAAATYWITGGLGAIGCETARWLARRGAKHLVLTGRRPPDSSAQDCIRDLEKLGVAARVLQADAGDRDRMRSVFEKIRNEMPPLRGVVHSAGAVRDAVLLNQDWKDAAEIFDGKVGGAWLLHELTRDIPLDFFILYSAAGVVLGAPGQGLYSAANAELDSLAKFRKRLGLPALSVAWGPWAGAGMAAELAARGRDVWETRGLRKIEPAYGFDTLERLLADKAAYAAVMPIDWSRFLGGLPPHADREFFGAVARSSQERPPAQKAGQGGIIERLRSLPSAQRKHAMISHLTTAIQALGIETKTPIELRVPLKEYGLDSLMAVELRNNLARSAGQALPATLLFDYPTLDALSAYLAQVWKLEDETGGPSQAEHADTSASLIADLSEEDAEALLLKELDLHDAERSA